MSKKTRTPKSVKKKKVQFKLNTDGAKEVYVLGDFNEWQTAHPMTQKKKGVWEKTIMLESGQYEYKFLVDEQWVKDSNNDQKSENCFGTFNNILNV